MFKFLSSLFGKRKQPEPSRVAPRSLGTGTARRSVFDSRAHHSSAASNDAPLYMGMASSNYDSGRAHHSACDDGRYSRSSDCGSSYSGGSDSGSYSGGDSGGGGGGGCD